MKNNLLFLFILSLFAVRAAVAAPTPSEADSWTSYPLYNPPGIVYSLHQSPSGIVRVGTGEGLYSFDGYSACPASGTDGRPFVAQVYAIGEAEDGTLWLGTNNGLFYISPGRNAVVEKPEGDFPMEIRTLLRLGDGRLMLGSLNGLFAYDPSDGGIEDMSSRIPHRAVYALLNCKADGRIYIGTYDGLCRYDPESGTFENVALDPGAGHERNIFVNALTECPDGTCVLVGTEGALLRFNTADGTVATVPQLQGNSSKAMAYGPQGRLAVATDNGLFTISPEGEVTHSRHDSRRTNSLPDNAVWSLMYDGGGNLWAGTNGGLAIADAASPVRVISMADITLSGEGQTVHTILRDSRGRLWLGGSNGLVELPGGLTSGASPGQTRWHDTYSSSYPLIHNRVRTLLETASGELLLGGDCGLNILDEATGRFCNVRLADSLNTHNANWTYAIVEDTLHSRLWVGSYLGGVMKVDYPFAGTRLVASEALNAEKGSLANNFISDMQPDAGGGVWVLLYRDGSLEYIESEGSRRNRRINVHEATGAWPVLISADPSGGVWVGLDEGAVVHIDSQGKIGSPVRFGREHTPSGTLYAMAQVGRELWVAAGDGVHAVSRDSGSARLLALPDYVYQSIYYDDLTRTVLLGTTDAIVQVDPRRLAARRGHRDIRIVRLRIGDEPIDVPSDEDTPVEVPYGRGALEVDLSTFDYTPNTFERFAYRVLPDGGWTLLHPNENTIALTGLPSGRHTLEMRIGDDDSTLRTMEVEILPPWYLSLPFKILWSVLFAAICFSVFFIVSRRQKATLQRLRRTNELAKAEERLNFLTNISHDLKTPLSMIIAPLGRVRSGEHSVSEVSEAIATAYNNALRLNRLLSHTLQSSRLDAATDSAAVTEPTDITSLVGGIFENFRSAYPACSLRFVAPADGEPLIAEVDHTKFESVVNNLLSNAIKYSASGKVDITGTLTRNVADGTFSLAVSDRGLGIMPDQIPLIFNRSYRTPRASDFSEGTGIGLYLVKHFVELHGGTVEVESEPGEGSTFSVTMPLKAAESVLEPKTVVNQSQQVPDLSRRRVLVVDDSEDILRFIPSLLEPEFQCAVATNGPEALEIARSFHPNLIITDQKMQGMTGLELAQKLKTTPATASISIILLTANASNELESRSVRAGIDHFMTKPFDGAMLRAQVERILRRKDEIARAARIEEITTARPIEIESDGERTLARVTSAVEANIASQELSVAFVCDTTGLTPKQLYRLIKKYLGITPVEYIRNTRLDKAAELLKKGELNVQEVMYSVGFSSSGYFSRCFAARFGVKPGEYTGR